MKTKNLNFHFDVLSKTYVYVIMFRFLKQDWSVLFVEHDKLAAVNTIRRFESCSVPCMEYKIVETELF